MHDPTRLQRFFQMHFPDYARTHALAPKHYDAANAILQCRTSALGGQIHACPVDHEERIQYHSCRHRSCPQCQSLPKAQWMQKQMARLLDTDHYHAIFTVPHTLLPLWRYNTRWFAQALFDAVRDTLLTLLHDSKHLGATPGVVLALHTWGRNLSLHPHIHALVTGGGLDTRGQWRSTRSGYLLPSRVVRRLFQGQLLGRLEHALRANALSFPPDLSADSCQRLLRALWQTKWNVRIQPPYTHGEGVMKYLARYVKGGPMHSTQMDDTSMDRVRFRYTDHRDGQAKTLALSQSDFLARWLDHVQEPRQHTVRYAGLYAHHAHDKRALCRAQLGQLPESAATPLDWQSFLAKQGHRDRFVCSQCQAPLTVRYRFGQNSFIKTKTRVPSGGHVQHAVEVDLPNATSLLFRSDPPPPPLFLRSGRQLN